MYYAQMGEDINLRRFFPHDPGFYIDVGVWEEQIDSVTKHFYESGWHGINIEPVPEFFERTAMLRDRDINLNVAVGSQNETRKFHHVRGSGLSSFHEENIKMSHNADRLIETLHVQTLTLAKVLDMYLDNTPSIDFLKIDVEGWELEVLKGMNFVNYRPRIVLYESTVPMTSGENAVLAPTTRECRELMVGAGYEYLDFDGLNDWWKAREFIPPVIYTVK